MPKKTRVKSSTETEPALEIKREATRSPDFFSVYTNDIQVQTSPWDMRIILGDVAKPAAANDLMVRINQLGEVRISLQLAKRLTSILIGQIQTYEERFGSIPSPPEE